MGAWEIFTLRPAIVCGTTGSMSRNVFAILALLLASPALADLPVEQARVERVLPHDPAAFTEGLFFDHGQLVGARAPSATGEPVGELLR